MSNPILGDLVNPFVRNPAFDTPEGSNFIERGISSGIEKGFGAVGDHFLHLGEIKARNMAQNLPELAGIALVSYYVYIGYKVFFKQNLDETRYIFPVTIIYVVFKLFFRVVLGI